MKQYQVFAKLDPETSIWYIDKTNVPGLHVEAASMQEFTDEVLLLAPMLIKENIGDTLFKPCDVPLELLYSQQTRIAVGC